MYDGVFISYRREGSSTFAGILYDALCKNFPASVVFKDKNKLLPGKDFREGINHAIDQAHTMLVLIDFDWLIMKDEKGKKKLFNKDDFIRYEVKMAIEKSKYIIPVLFDGGKMPKEKELPAEIKKLCNFQAFEIDADNISKSIMALIDHIRSLSTEKLGNTFTESIIKIRKDPKGAFKKISDAFIDMGKRESNVLTHYLKKVIKKKKE